MIQTTILLAIRLYQRHISPYKGFHCAFHAHTGRDTCSGYGYRVFARYGTLFGYRLLRRRFAACSKVAAMQYRPAPVRQTRLAVRQGGFVDCNVPGCDVPNCDASGCDLLGNACDILNGIGDLFSLRDRCCGGRHTPRQASRGGHFADRLKEWDCADWFNLLLVLALIGGLVYLAYHFGFKH